MKKNIVSSLIIIVLIATISQISTDIYIPSLPAIASDLHASVGQVQLTMALFMAGVGITNLLYGPLSEGIGRRNTLLIGLTIALVGTFICLLSQHITTLQLGRLIQGCGMGACSALWRSIFRDTYSGETLARMSSHLVKYVIISVIIAPLIGGYFQHYFSWHATFLFLLFWMALVMGVIALFFTESSQNHSMSRLSWSFIQKSYRELLLQKRFISFCFIIFFTYGGLFAWLTSGSVILIEGIGMSPLLFGYTMIASGVATALGGGINARLLKHLSLNKLVGLGIVIMGISGLLILLSITTFGVNLYTVLIPTLLFIIGSTFLFVNCFAIAFEDVGHIAGYAGSLYASIQLLGGATFAGILGHSSTTSPIPMALMFLASSLCSGVIFAFGKQP